MSYRPGDTVRRSFVVSDSTDAPTNFSGTPTASVLRNTTADGTVTATITSTGTTGRYYVSFTIPTGYTAGDTLEVEVAGTVAGSAKRAVFFIAVIEATRSTPQPANVTQFGGTAIAFAAGDLTTARLAKLGLLALTAEGRVEVGRLLGDGDAVAALAGLANFYDENSYVNASISAVAGIPASFAGTGASVLFYDSIAKPGDAMTLTTGERTSIATAVWASTTRTLSGLTVGGGISSADKDDIAARVQAALAGREIIISSPVLSDGSIEIYAGDAYPSTRPLPFTILNYAGPSLNGAAVAIRFIESGEFSRRGSLAAHVAQFTTTITQAGSTLTMNFQATSVETAAIANVYPAWPSPTHQVQIIATASNATLVDVPATVKRRIS